MIDLWDHQIKGKEFILNRNGTAGLLHDMGLGKTITTLSTYHQLKQTEPRLKLFVICPINLIHMAWVPDIHLFNSYLDPDEQYKYFNLRNRTKRDRWMKKESDIFLWNYASFRTYDKKTLLNDPIFWVLDESSKIKTHDIPTTKNILKYKDQVQYKSILTGTPAPNNELEYWAQLYFINANVPESYFKFRNVFFEGYRGNQTINGSLSPEMLKTGFKYRIKEHMKLELQKILNESCHIQDYCLDLPANHDVPRYMELNKKEADYYKQMQRDYIIQIDQQQIMANNALTKLMKLRQITSGFVIDENANGICLTSQPTKFKELKHILNENGGKQAVIWINFTNEADYIEEHLKGSKRITGKTREKDRIKILNEFKNNEFPYLIAHPKCLGHGVTITNCNYAIFYSIDYSYEFYAQCRKRMHRPGQKNECFNIYMMAKGTIDEKIYEVLQNKGDMQKILHTIKEVL